MHTANPNFLLFPEPLLSTSSASLLSFVFATTYVGSIYFSRRTRLSLGSRNTKSDTDDAGNNSTKGTRDDPDIVRARLLAVSIATAVCCAGVFSVLWGRMRWDANVSTYSYHKLIAYLTNSRCAAEP
jgi:prenyl protein peptidase